MSAAIDKALMAMSLEEEEVPFDLPDRPEFSACEKNEISLIGRLLNPDCQSMSDLIKDMPRKWQLYDRVRGLALSKERFQFIFQYEHDLEMVLQKGVQSFNQWTIAIERWVEKPPADYLQFIHVWVQLRNIPVNHFTVASIHALGEFAGQVVVVAFDPLKPQDRDFVRVLVKFDVSKPLRRVKVVNVPNADPVSIRYDFEKIQKRCYTCQRVNHEQEKCPIFLRNQLKEREERKDKGSQKKAMKEPVLKSTDPLFGVLKEDQVGVNPLTGRPRIAPEVLEGMRQYLLVANGDDRIVREERVKSSLASMENDPLTQKTVLRLEQPLIISPDVDKDKGIVFDFQPRDQHVEALARLKDAQLKLSAAFRAGAEKLNILVPMSTQSATIASQSSGISLFDQDCPTGYRIGFSEAGSSGTKLRKTNPRKRPGVNNRKKKVDNTTVVESSYKGKEVKKRTGGPKRKAGQEVTEEGQSAKRTQPSVVPSEGSLQLNVLVDLQEWLGYDRVYTVEPEGLSGGLALFWKSTVQIELKFVDKHLLDLHVQFGNSVFYVSCIYGNPVAGLRSEVWERLSRIGTQRTDPWCMMGDFNEILHNGEKLGGPRRNNQSFQPFVDMLAVCGMTELKSKGNSFTWGGMRGTMWIQCKLDRSFGNKEWYKFFPASNQFFLDKRGSDHRPVLVSLLASKEAYRGRFRFDKRFLFKPNVKEAIRLAWRVNDGNLGSSVSDSLRGCRKALSKWKKENQTNSLDKIGQFEASLELEQSAHPPCSHKVFVLKRELALAYKEEESFWSQKCSHKWLKDGDSNTKYFHNSVKANRSRKGLSKLVDANGVVQRSEAAKGEVAAAYFSELFKTSDPGNFQELFEDFTPRVSVGMNAVLIKTVSKDEIKEAVFSIKPASAPGADGMTGLFFQHYWGIIGERVTSEVQDFFENGVFPKEWNYTQLCLIPKIVVSVHMSDLRPISLCSVLYKIIAKIMVKRLQPFLPDLVSTTQSAFVPERLISDNIMVAHELVHALGTHPIISKEFMAVKTDMSKAYDRVEWSYLQSLLLALGFHAKWVGWIMSCVTTVTYSVLINDQEHGMIVPQRGLRQGDPLSPFLFVLCTEGLTHMLNRAELNGSINGIQFSEEGPAVHHLFFADDSLFLCKADLSQCSVLSAILMDYGGATGQIINLQKSSVTFGNNVDESLRPLIQHKLGIMNEGGAGTYLGLPECFSGSKIEMLDYIHERLKSKLSGWFARSLSQGGKEVLLKAVAMAMPVYAMSCFKLPVSTCKSLTSAMADFWWHAFEHKRKIHWISWEKLCLSKEHGGLGFRDIQCFNQALLAKQAWRLMQFPDCLLSKLLKSRYFKDSDFLESVTGDRPSFAWRSVLHGRELLEKGLRRGVGNGKSLNVWMDPWVCDEDEMRPPYLKQSLRNICLKVSDLIDLPNRGWDVEILDDLFLPQDIQRIMANKPAVDHDDFWIWKHNKSGDYSVKSGYAVAFATQKKDLICEATLQPSLNGLKIKVWGLQTAPKIKTFLWKALSGALAVGERLATRGMRLDQRCQFCGEEFESINHVLFTCAIARQVWALSLFPSPASGFSQSSIFANFQYVLSIGNDPQVPIEISQPFPWILWVLWKNRNKFTIEGKQFLAVDTINKIKGDASQWLFSQSAEKELDQLHENERRLVKKVWKPPDSLWDKCNIGVSWLKRKNVVGASWVVRDSHGRVKLHSRRMFSNISSWDDAYLECFFVGC
ncbi:Endonuclease/exonuclease/phosphatase superfamily [Arabidopsis thaliana x Arabidopsis arenosa]|uniref:Endonuclease/exonuclease/phosphatase superfamily n=1 Tax=Arabidopsis thaliana x Arabidopsis arenosa TaxID=1240361 RepID=A0A8T2C0A2_9BRAS|nr:Endonuclease/exonuclease/phosphatase superfamily [Arabidopsis thaliana x Arabidopsis arenosa]